MSQQSYNYENRTGIRPVSWEDFHGLCKGLATAVWSFQPEIIIAVGRGGYYPGTLLAHMLQVELYPVRLSRRVNDIVIYDQPRWLVEPPAEVKDRRVLVVDEICATGETLTMIKQKVESLGATEVKTAVLYAHTWGATIPDYIGLISDALLLNPWDREILRADGFQFHPEYVAALAQQGILADSSLLIDTPVFPIAKTDSTRT
jgi:hypoxanthine phosphoribosyltransferase